MRILVVIGAGASFDSWPELVFKRSMDDDLRIPLANLLFEPKHTQNDLLNKYHLMGIASALRASSRLLGNEFSIENELAKINYTAIKRKDPNNLEGLFKTRFYLHSLITRLTNDTIQKTSSHTVYVDLLRQLKNWIDESPDQRCVDLVVFNYDTLIEQAMETVYCFNWRVKNGINPLSAYYQGKNLKIYKPHGSINWGREIVQGEGHYVYYDTDSVISNYENIEFANSFQKISVDVFENYAISKNFVPAIAIPFKGKTDFQECPEEMQVKMLEATKKADKLITLGWRGADEHFTKLLKENTNIDDVYVVSPNADTHLDKIFPHINLTSIKTKFSSFVSDTSDFENLLSRFN